VRLGARHERELVGVTFEVGDVTDTVTGAEVEDAPRSCGDDAAAFVADVRTTARGEKDRDDEQKERVVPRPTREMLLARALPHASSSAHRSPLDPQPCDATGPSGSTLVRSQARAYEA
jgi:hypothetical protein